MISICINFPDGIPIKIRPTKSVARCSKVDALIVSPGAYLSPKNKYEGYCFVGAYDVCNDCEE